MGRGIQRVASLFVVMLMGMILPGCGGGGGEVTPSPSPTPVPDGVGSVSGRLTVPGVLGANQARLATASDSSVASPPAESDVEPDFVPGEFIVSFKPEISEADAMTRLLQAYADVKLEIRRPSYPGGPHILRTDAYKNKKLSREEAKERTRLVLQRLKVEPEVLHVGRNLLFHAQVTPVDPGYVGGLQWGLRTIGLPAAWELTTGSPEVVVAVLDGGIRKEHPELAPLLEPGYDFVSDLDDSADGDGIDEDPSEPLGPYTSYHGTHVAGTIAAVSDNPEGVAGVAWKVKLMPVRVLGILDSNLEDVKNGILYAAGLPNSSGKIPARPAQVINMSLGNQVSCSDPEMSKLQQAITAARDKGVTIVVAAGNEALTGNPPTSPASCEHVIAVGAVTANWDHAPYSTHHPYVDIAAPGGLTWDTPFGGILSTMKVSPANKPQYIFMNGTSMAAPHVAGVVALMRSVNSSLTPDRIEEMLKATAVDLVKRHASSALNLPELNLPGKDEYYGHGLVRADRAVAAAAGVSPPSVPIPYPLPALVELNNIFGSIDVPVSNLGGGLLQLSNVQVRTVTGGSWLAAQLLDNNKLRISVQGGLLLLPDTYLGFVLANTTGGPLIIPVLLRHPFQSLPDFGQITVRLIGQHPATRKFETLATTTTDVSRGFAYSFPSIAPGEYLVRAGNDLDGSGEFGDSSNEVRGDYPILDTTKKIIVEAGKVTSNVNFPITKGTHILVPGEGVELP